MVRSCPLAELFSALAQSGYSKSTQSRATKHGVGLGGRPRCDCVKQQNDPFVLQSQPCRRGNAAHFLRFFKQFHGRDPDCLRTEAVAAHSRVLLTTAMARKTPFRLYVRHFDRHVMAGDSKATICRHHDAVTRKGPEVVSLIFDRNVIAGDIRDRARWDAKHLSCKSKNDSVSAHLTAGMP